jgi:hypothetical protein
VVRLHDLSLRCTCLVDQLFHKLQRFSQLLLSYAVAAVGEEPFRILISDCLKYLTYSIHQRLSRTGIRLSRLYFSHEPVSWLSAAVRIATHATQDRSRVSSHYDICHAQLTTPFTTGRYGGFLHSCK